MDELANTLRLLQSYIEPPICFFALDCGSPILEKVEDYVYSPNYPGDMPLPTLCEWRIQVKGKRVGIIAILFDDKIFVYTWLKIFLISP